MGRDGRGVKGISESTIEITFMYKGERCRERIALKPTPANLKRAEQHRAAVIVAIAAGTFDYAATFPNSKRASKFAHQPGDTMFLGEYLARWLDKQKALLKASTYDGYRKVTLGYLIPWFDKTGVSAFRKKDLIEELEKLEVGNKTLANIQSVMRAALTYAVEIEEIIEVNPLAGYTYARNEAPREKDQIDPFSKDEQDAILGALEGQARNLVQFAFWTGLRTSELVALDWGDIDFVRGVVRVSRAITQKADEAEVPKTEAGTRDVKLLAAAAEALAAQKQFTWLKGKEVFQNPQTGERWAGDQPIRKTMWQWAVKKSGVRYRYPYQTRHTYASMMLSAGEHPMWVAKQMGHADWTMIARRYGRWMPDADSQAGSRAEAIYGDSTSEASRKTS